MLSKINSYSVKNITFIDAIAITRLIPYESFSISQTATELTPILILNTRVKINQLQNKILSIGIDATIKN